MSTILGAASPPGAVLGAANTQNGSRPSQLQCRSGVLAQRTAVRSLRPCLPVQQGSCQQPAAARRPLQQPCVSASASAGALDLAGPSTSACEPACGPLGFQTGFASAFTLGRHIGSGEALLSRRWPWLLAGVRPVVAPVVTLAGPSAPSAAFQLSLLDSKLSLWVRCSDCVAGLAFYPGALKAL